jgi:DNA-binding MarR family transcriptional regulator
MGDRPTEDCMDKKQIQLNENEVLWGRLFLNIMLVERAREVELSRVHMSLIQAMVLYALKISPEPLTPSKLARMLCREQHSMSALIDRMEKQGLVEKKHDLHPRNLVRVVTTAKGEEAFQRQRSLNAVISITSILTKEEREILGSCADKLGLRARELLREMQPDPYGEPLFS